MELYRSVSYAHSKQLTRAYSSSFGMSSRLFGRSIKDHIYAIYGLVRIADEVVDTYKGGDAEKLLSEFERATYDAIDSGFSTNPIIHAFALTARQFSIEPELITPFFESMRMDLAPQTYKTADYASYIHGSAEVVGLMCLRVFCEGDNKKYDMLKEGAAALGSAYQKVNFLRDLAADYNELGRLYFPDTTFEAFDEHAKQSIIDDIKRDFTTALPALGQLPQTSRSATMLSYVYYMKLLHILETTPAHIIKTTRIRIPTYQKLLLFVRVAVTGRW